MSRKKDGRRAPQGQLACLVKIARQRSFISYWTVQMLINEFLHGA
jgi:hypothetical protein